MIRKAARTLAALFVLTAAVSAHQAAASTNPPGMTETKLAYCNAVCSMDAAMNCTGTAEYCAGYYTGCVGSCLVF